MNYNTSRMCSSVFLSILTVAAVFLMAGCDPATNAKGTVRDTNGAALANVAVTMFSSSGDSAEKKKESEQNTDKEGKFNFVTITPGADRITLVFVKQGFQTIEKEIGANVGSEVEVIMEPAVE